MWLFHMWIYKYATVDVWEVIGEGRSRSSGIIRVHIAGECPPAFIPLLEFDM